MKQPATKFLNRMHVYHELRKRDTHDLTNIIDEMADDMRDLIEANRRYALEKYGSDKKVEDYYCVKKLRNRLESLGYITEDTGGNNERTETYVVVVGDENN